MRVDPGSRPRISDCRAVLALTEPFTLTSVGPTHGQDSSHAHTYTHNDSSLDKSGLSLHVRWEVTHSGEVHLFTPASLLHPSSGAPQAGRGLLGLRVR